MAMKNKDTQQKLLSRLKRIEGQVRGVHNMIETDRECREIMQQLTAIRSAVNGVTSLLIQEYASDCLLSPDSDPERRKEILGNLIDMLDKAP